MERLGAYADAIPPWLEDSREPPEVISRRSLGQAADALTTPRVPQLRVLQFHPRSPPWSSRSSFGEPVQDLDAVDDLSVSPSPNSTTAEHDYAALNRRVCCGATKMSP